MVFPRDRVRNGTKATFGVAVFDVARVEVCSMSMAIDYLGKYDCVDSIRASPKAAMLRLCDKVIVKFVNGGEAELSKMSEGRADPV